MLLFINHYHNTQYCLIQILINLIYLQKEFEQNQTIRPSVGILVGAQILYCVFVYFWDEAQAVFSFDIKYEALGFLNLIGNLAITPFIYTSPIRFLIDHPKSPLVPLPMLVTATILLGKLVLLTIRYVLHEPSRLGTCPIICVLPWGHGISNPFNIFSHPD